MPSPDRGLEDAIARFSLPSCVKMAHAQSVEFLASVKSEQSIFLGDLTEAGAEIVKVINANVNGESVSG